jgi:hypothetical protein
MSERRNPSLARVPFEALVEIAAPEGTSFEAESVDLSATGMHLKTAYLPRIGTPLTFRFEPGAEGAPILANGEVVWAHDGAEGCEFGVRFGEMKPEGAEAIRQIVGIGPSGNTLAGVGPVVVDGGPPSTPTLTDPMLKRPVRIHIEGITAPMRATLRDDALQMATVGSELKMLKIGSIVELEDKETRARRPARVAGVECEIDPNSRVPQLVVKLRYDSEAQEAQEEPRMEPKMEPKIEAREAERAQAAEMEMEAAPPETSSETMPPPEEKRAKPAGDQIRVSLPVGKQEGRLDGMADGMKKVGSKMKDAWSGFGSVAARFGTRAKTTVALLSKRNKTEADDTRRTTSPAPGSTVGKARTLRPQAASRDFSMGVNDMGEEGVMQEIDSKKSTRRKQIGIAAGVGVALVLGFLAFRKPHHAPPAITQAPVPELAPASSVASLPAAPAPASSEAVTAVAGSPASTLVGDSTGVDAKGNPNPFGTPTVKKGTHMVLRLDGPVTELRGMQMPNGFVISVPNRKSLEAAGPLAAKDPRISSAKVVNQGAGAELTLAFKDNAPPYLVKAKGDTLEIILGHEKAMAKKGKGKAGSAAPAGAPKPSHPKKK